jgi:hypothetical protein
LRMRRQKLRFWRMPLSRYSLNDCLDTVNFFDFKHLCKIYCVPHR